MNNRTPAPALTAVGAAEPSLRGFALAAVATVACGDGAQQSDECRFLLGHLDAVAPDGADWADRLSAHLSRPSRTDAVLRGAAAELGLTALDLLAVALAEAVEDDVMVGRALAHVQAPVGGSRPTFGLLAAALGRMGPPGARPVDALVNGAAVRSGFLTVSAEPAPLPERTVAVPQALGLALRGQVGHWAGTAVGYDGPNVPLPRSVVADAKRHGAGLAAAVAPVLVLRTASAAEGRSVAAEVARELGRTPLFVSTDRLDGMGAWAVLRRFLPVFVFDLAPGDRRAVPPLFPYRGPVLVLCGPDGSVENPAGTVVTWALPVPARDERRALWEAAVGGSALAAELATAHRHGTGRIAHLGRVARHHAGLNGRAEPTRADVTAAAWVGEGSGLDALAQPLPEPIPDEALVLLPALRRELDLLVLRCRGRDALADGLGASATARYRPGVSALFVGPSGTGKTLAAGWLATRLGLPLYRVDLAAITSKYIGETEKNLAQLMARAERAEVVLLFDEADSLFGKRTDVKEANDRFANAQTNYLLQRIESFDGITVLTSNSRGRFDSAFSRRIDAILEFPLPGPEERRELWLAHLGESHELSHPDLNQLAATADLTGGHIRNAVFAAAVLAREAERRIVYADVLEGVAGEYRKLGRRVPVELHPGT